MARLPFPETDGADTAALVNRIVAERGSLLALYRLLLHSPPIAEGWLTFLTAVRQRSSLDPAIRELVIMRIAQINKAPYEAEQHRPIALAEGVSAEKLDRLQDWATADLFDQREQAALALTDSMTREIQVSTSCFEAGRANFSDREMVELAVTIAAYNMVSRFLEAVELH